MSMVEKSFFDGFASMSFSELRRYIDSRLYALENRLTDATVPGLDRDDFRKLVDLLSAKADDPLLAWESERKANPLSGSRSIPFEEFARLQAEKTRLEHSRAEQLRFCERIRRDIERIFTRKPTAPVNNLYWHILPHGEWTVDAVVLHYSKLQKTNPAFKFDLDHLRQVFSLGPSTLYVGTDEFEGYIVFAFPETKKVVLECPVYGNAIYIIRENWETLSRFSKGGVAIRFPGGSAANCSCW